MLCQRARRHVHEERRAGKVGWGRELRSVMVDILEEMRTKFDFLRLLSDSFDFAEKNDVNIYPELK